MMGKEWDTFLAPSLHYRCAAGSYPGELWTTPAIIREAAMEASGNLLLLLLERKSSA